MFVSCVRLVLLAAGVYFSYRAARIFNDHRHMQPEHMIAEPERRTCIICQKLVEASHARYNGSCSCWAHNGCMVELIKEGMEKCPKCKKPLNNRQNTAEDSQHGSANSRRSFDGASTTRRKL